MKEIKSKSSLSDRAAIIIVGDLINSVLSTIGALILIRVLSKTTYGTYSQAFLLFNTFSSLFLIGLPASLYYFVPLYSRERRKALIIQTYIMVLLAGLILGGLLIFGRGLISSLFGNINLNPILIPFSFYVFLSLPVGLFRPILISLNQHQAIAIGGILSDMIVQITLVVTGLLNFDLDRMFQAIAIAAAVRLVAMIGYIFWIQRGSRIEWDKKILKEQVDYSSPLAIANFIGLLSSRIDSFVISMNYPPEMFATYNVGAREIPLVGSITYSIGQVILPHLVAHFKEGRKKEFVGLWHEATRKIALIMLPIFIFLLLYAQPFIILLFSASYSDSVVPFIIFLFLLPLRVTSYGNIIRAMGMTKPLLIGTLMTGAFTIGFNFLFIEIFGFIGPAIVSVLVTYLQTFYYLWLAKNNLSISFSRIMPWGKLIKIIGIASIAAIPAIIPLFLIKNLWLQFIAGFLIYALFYLLIGFFTQVIRKEDFKLLFRWLNIKTILGYQK